MMAITGKTKNTKSHMAASAPRVPVIIRATILNPKVKAINAMREEFFDWASMYAENGKVQTTNSAKKFRLTKVDAGLGPCGKYVKSK